MDDQIALTEALVREIVAAADGWRTAGGTRASAARCEFSARPFSRCTWDDAFQRAIGQPVLDCSVSALIAIARERQLELPGPPESLTQDTARNFLLASVVEPQLGTGHPEFLTHFPASQAALAKISPLDSRVALRFELFANGLELCNGYEELADQSELEQRDANENSVREMHGNDVLPGAPRLLAAMRQGLPPCSGVALGFDRLVMLATGADSIRAVIPFPFDTA